MTINGCLLHKADDLRAQENEQENFAKFCTLETGLATNCHLKSLRGVRQNDEEYNKIGDYYTFARLANFSPDTSFRHSCYKPLRKLEIRLT